MVSYLVRSAKSASRGACLSLLFRTVQLCWSVKLKVNSILSHTIQNRCCLSFIIYNYLLHLKPSQLWHEMVFPNLNSLFFSFPNMNCLVKLKQDYLGLPEFWAWRQDWEVVRNKPLMLTWKRSQPVYVNLYQSDYQEELN